MIDIVNETTCVAIYKKIAYEFKIYTIGVLVMHPFIYRINKELNPK